MQLAPQSPSELVKAPKTRKSAAPRALRDRISQYLHYSVAYPQATKTEIAEKMGIVHQTLSQILREGQDQGLLVFTDPLERIDYEIIPKIVDNLNYFLTAKDKTVTIEAAKGTLFKAYADSKGIIEGNQTMLALKIEPASGTDVKILAGHIVGQPKTILEAQLDDYDDQS